MAAPVQWLTEFQANTGAANVSGISDTRAVGLSNGNFLVTWVEAGITGIGTTAGTDIIGAIYDAEGNLVRAPYRVNTGNNADDERDYDISPTNDGGFIIVFVDDDISNSAQEAIIWQRHDANGDQTNSFTVATNSVAADVLSNPTVAVNLNNNTSFVTFNDRAGGDDDVRAVLLSATGVVTTAEFDAAQNSNDIDREADSAVNINGELVTVYQEDDAGVLGIEVRVTSTAGLFQHSAQAENVASSDAQVTTLLNGNIVVVWVDGNDVQYRVYDSNLGTVAGPFNVDGSGDNKNEPEVAALPDGGFVIVWDNDTDNTIEARRFTQEGSVIGGQDNVFVIEDPLGTEVTPTVSAMVDGRILFAFENSDDAFATIWDTRGDTIDTVDFAALPPNFIEGSVVTSNVIDTTINGDGGADTLLGQDGNDELLGGGGGDLIRGGGGNDTIEGGLAQDTLEGGLGNDVFIVRNGEFADDINGNGGNDTLDLSNRTDVNAIINLLTATYTNQNGGNDIFNIETVIGTQLNDEITSTFGTQNLQGEGGNDTFIHGNGQFIDDIDGGIGVDELDASGVTNASEGMNFNLVTQTWDGLGGPQDLISVETIHGTQASDIFRGINGSTFFGNGGSDMISFQSGDGLPDFNGGLGTDTADFSTFSSVINFYIDLDLGGYVFGSTLPGSFSGDLTGFENYMGSAGIDVLIGNSENNVFDGNDGDDEAFGGMGDDTLRGDNGVDNLRGEEGNDILSGNDDNDVLNGGDGDDVLFGGSGNDLMFGGNNFDQMFGGAGVDRMFGGANNDIANGGADNDIINTGSGNDLIFAQNGNDLVFAQAGNDDIFGGAGNDKLFGGNGNDEINGGAGNDEIFGGADVDLITGAAGNDIMSGGGGVDTFFFFSNQGDDRITDYTSIDRLDIGSFGVTDTGGSNFDWLNATTSVVTSGGGANVTISWVGGGTLTIENIGIPALTDADFNF